MLEHLDIRNYALIENLSIDFSDGFNVITGETGSGKSIILGALGLLMGEKADASAIRNGADEISINAIVSIPKGHSIRTFLKERGIETEDDRVVIRRIVKANGRSSISIQGQVVTRQELVQFADSVIDMHGQSEHQSLLIPDKQREILDSYAQNAESISKCSGLCREIAELENRKKEIEKAIEEGKRQEDYLTFALEEIKGANITDDSEDETLKEKIGVLGQFENIYENLNMCTDKLKETNNLLYDASAFCQKAAKYDAELTQYISRLEGVRIESDDISQSLKAYLSSVDYSEDAVNQMQDRLSVLQKLKRKYGSSLKEVMAFAQDAEEKLDIMKNSCFHLEKCESELLDAKNRYKAEAENLTQRRKNSAGVLQLKIESVLRMLGMPNAKFSIDVVTDNERISHNGSDSIVFMIAPNPGENPKELRSIASGGELSRVMLALKTVLASSDSIQTQVFDEVDSGIGGSVALSLAQCINNLAKSKQVIAITHLASIAGTAETHFVVSKSVDNGRTYTHLSCVEGEDRVHEIARMLSGDEENITLEHAREILKR